MPNRPTILVVEDAPDVRILIANSLKAHHYEVVLASGVVEARQALATHDPDLVVLDIGLPDGDGLELCRRIRAERDTYVILLTTRSDEMDRVVGLSVGADDYITKPFSPRELVARIEARLRRPLGSAAGAAGAGGDAEQLRYLDLELDVAGRELRRGDVAVALTRIEFDLLRVLMAKPGRVHSRDALLVEVWGDTWVGEGRLVEVHVSKLRAKLGDDPGSPRYIRTVRGVGYRMASRS